MKAAAIVALPLILALAMPMAVDAKSPSSSVSKSRKAKKAKPVAVAMADAMPLTRIRNARNPDGLTPLEFAKWLRAHPQLADSAPEVRKASLPTRLLNRSAEHFVEADRNGDGRVSPDELADFVQPEPTTAMRRVTPTI